jgi:hypothetical protein
MAPSPNSRALRICCSIPACKLPCQLHLWPGLSSFPARSSLPPLARMPNCALCRRAPLLIWHSRKLSLTAASRAVRTPPPRRHEMGYPVRSSTRKPSPEIPTETESLSPVTLLKELFDLLESYAPTWYTEEHHDRAAAVLLRSTEYHLRAVEARQETRAHRTHCVSGRKHS